MEKKITIELKSADDVQRFLSEVILLRNEYDLISGRYVIDAKSMLGIYSLNLSKPLELVMRGENADEIAVLDKYRVKA